MMMKKLKMKPKATYMTASSLTDNRTGHIAISEYGTMIVHNGDTTYASYYGVYQNLMYL